MPFSKYKGKGLNEIYAEDSSYLNWCLNNLNLQESLKKAIEEVISEHK